MSNYIIRHNKQDCNPDLPQIRGTGEVLKDYSPTGKKRKWEQYKQQNLALHGLYMQTREQDPHIITVGRLWDLEQCGNLLEYGVDANGNKQLRQAYFCRNRFCPICAWRRSLKLFGQVSSITNKILEKDKTVRFLFVTFTQRNVTGEKLSTMLDDINTGFKRVAGKQYRFAPATIFKSNLQGYIRSMEITYNSKTNTYHPHLHCVFAVKGAYFKRGYITAMGWRELWKQALKLDYLPQVNIQAINVSSKAVAELTKYPAKIADVLELDVEKGTQALITLTKVCRKRHFVTFGGVFKRVKQELKLQDVESSKTDLIHTEDAITGFNAVARVIYVYNAKMGVYIC